MLWHVPASTAYPEALRYRLAYLRAGTKIPAVLYDNHRPKGHHRHRRGLQGPYAFATVDQLLRDFLADVRQAKAARKMMEGTP